MVFNVILNSHDELSKCVNDKPGCKCTDDIMSISVFTELTMLTLMYILYIITMVMT